jgi:hypothetical protein
MKFFLWGPVQPLTVDRLASAWFYIMSALQAKPTCSLDGSSLCSSLTVSGGPLCLDQVLLLGSGDTNYYLPH